MCGHNRDEALAWLARLERLTQASGERENDGGEE
jgi:hypothetical protein